MPSAKVTAKISLTARQWRIVRQLMLSTTEVTEDRAVFEAAESMKRQAEEVCGIYSPRSKWRT